MKLLKFRDTIGRPQEIDFLEHAESSTARLIVRSVKPCSKRQHRPLPCCTDWGSHVREGCFDPPSAWVFHHSAIPEDTSHRGQTRGAEHVSLALCFARLATRDSIPWGDLWRQVSVPSRVPFKASSHHDDYSIRKIWSEHETLFEYVWFPPWELESFMAHWVHPCGPGVFYAWSQWASDLRRNANIWSQEARISSCLLCFQCRAVWVPAAFPWVLWENACPCSGRGVLAIR